jgi:hypothetical protein
MYVGERKREYMGISVVSPQFCCDPKSIKNRVFKMNERMHE